MHTTHKAASVAVLRLWSQCAAEIICRTVKKYGVWGLGGGVAKGSGEREGRFVSRNDTSVGEVWVSACVCVCVCVGGGGGGGGGLEDTCTHRPGGPLQAWHACLV